MLPSSVINRGFEPWLEQIKDYKFVSKACSFQGVKAKTSWLGIRIVCPSGTASLRVSDCCTLLYIIIIYIYNWIGNKLTSPSPYKYINNINKTNQMTANVQAISIISSKLSKIKYTY
jgi:hypothetical protein